MKITIGYTTGEYFDAEALRMELLGRYEGIAEIKIALDGYGKEREALTNAIERLEALEIPTDARVYVDDENRCPSRARYWWVVSDERDSRGYRTNAIELDDDELDDAVAWLPSESFLFDQSDGPYNPYTTLDHLRTLEVS